LRMSTGTTGLCSDRPDDQACLASASARQESKVLGAFSGVSYAVSGLAAIGSMVYVVLPQVTGVTARTTGRSVTVSIVF